MPIPTGDDGFAYDQVSGVAYLYSGQASLADPAGQSPNQYLFKVPASGKPELLKSNLDEDAVAFAADFTAQVVYVILPSGVDGSEINRITEAGQITRYIKDDVISISTASRLGTDSTGKIYVSRAVEEVEPATFIIALEKWSADGTTKLLRFTGTDNVFDFDVEGGFLYTDLGQKFDIATGSLVDTFTLVPNSRWFAADPGQNILFGDDSGLGGQPQALTLEQPDGTLLDAGQLPERAERVDF